MWMLVVPYVCLHLIQAVDKPREADLRASDIVELLSSPCGPWALARLYLSGGVVRLVYVRLHHSSSSW